jgi:hypothetical protein
MQGAAGRILFVAGAAIVGGVAGGRLAVSRHAAEAPPALAAVAHPPEAGLGSPPPSRTADLAPSVARGFYLSTLRTGGVDVSALTALIVTPLETDAVTPECPPGLVLRRAPDYRATILPHVEAVGAIALGASGEGSLLAQAAECLDETWRTIRSIARGPVGVPALRALVRHYPRTDLPGRCVAIETTWYTTRDPLLEGGSLPPPGPIRGVHFTIGRLYQLERGEPRIVAARIEAWTDLEALDARARLDAPDVAWAERLDPMIRAILQDPYARAHFAYLGGGRRVGAVWLDRSLGLAHETPWSACFDSEARSATTRVEEGLPPPAVQSLVTLASRS